MRVRRTRPPSFSEMFTPKLVTVLREGYRLRDFRTDAIAGLSVAVVALPLSLAIAVASGLSPDHGLYTAIVGGFIISTLGGSRFQIGGPAVMLIVLSSSIVEHQGYEGLVLVTMMAGCFMLVVGFMRWGTYIKYIPSPVTVGFTAGVSIVIFVGQLKELLGLYVYKEPTALAPKLATLWSATGTIHPTTIAVSVVALAIILGIRRIRPGWPAMFIAVAVCAAMTGLLHLDVATIGSRFSGVPKSLPAPVLPAFDLARMLALLPDAISITLIGSIESLLSAVIADGMSGRRHRSNCELVAQGVANIAAAICGGMPVAGAVACTATNVRSGAKGPISGILHAVYVLLFMVVAAPLASYIPLAALGGVITVVAWNMLESGEFVSLVHSSKSDALVLLSTFFLTIFASLTLGIAVGVTLASFQFLHRMAKPIEVKNGGTFSDDQGDDYDSKYADHDAKTALDVDFMVYKVSGAFFFGAIATASAVLNEIGKYPRIFVFDFTDVALMDTTAAKSMKMIVRKLRRADTRVFIASAGVKVRSTLMAAGLRDPEVVYSTTVGEARLRSRSARVLTQLSVDSEC
jgi:sulfate permease, SulP family